ncbi:Vacuolar protein sorting-associated protein 45 [Sarcoptes scabiei]|nr:Vacuolar protein sorting-associated protein 45 [Sarcoptes scabiei]
MVSDKIYSLETDPRENDKLSVCIVGIGAAGLCSLRHFSQRLDLFDIDAYEQTDDIGGTWNYTDHIGFDPKNGLPVHSSMYKNLYTNLPMEIMEFPDYKSNSKRSYVHHTQVLNYLKQYARHFDLYRFMKFNHIISSIDRSDNKWNVIVEDLITGEKIQKHFDIILICTGRYSIPFWPKYKSLPLFQGNIIHSHDYRVPEVYQNQRVAVIGGGLSGVDITIELSRHCKEVIFINRGKHQYKQMPNNIRQVNVEVEEFRSNSMIVKDRKTGQLTSFDVDSIIMATGYLYNIRYLNSNAGIQMNPDGTINGLYKHLINIAHPSMALLGVAHHVVPLPLYHQQILYYMKILTGEIRLPSKSDMIKDTETDLQERMMQGLRPKDRHLFQADRMESYLDDLSEQAKIRPLNKVILKLHRELFAVRLANILTYKRFDYRLISDEDYVAIENNQQH